MRISNNIIAILVIIFIIFTIINDYRIYNSISGYISQGTGIVSICIGGSPNITQLLPGAGVISGLVNVSAIVTGSSMGEGVNRSVFFYNYLGDYYLIGIDYYDGDTNYSYEWNTTMLSDGYCNYFLAVKAYGECLTSEMQGGLFTLNNYNVEPKWDNFKNNYTTNFSNFTYWLQLSNITIGNENGFVEIPYPYKVDLDDFDLDSNMKIEHNNFTIPSLQSNCEKITAHITMNNITWLLPLVLKNGIPCQDCVILSYDGNKLKFSANEVGGIYTTIENASLEIEIQLKESTQDNTPLVNVTTYYLGSNNRTINATANCSYKTDYNPIEYTQMDSTNSNTHYQELPQHYYSYIYIPVPSLYKYIQHRNYIEGNHTLYIRCSDGERVSEKVKSFTIIPPKRNKVFYKANDNVEIYQTLDYDTLNITANLSAIDSNFNPENITQKRDDLNYTLYYTISQNNTIKSGQYNITIYAYNNSFIDMNQTIFMHYKAPNSWTWNDTDHAISCYTRNPGWYFDEISCSWKSDVNFAIKKQAGASVEEECEDSIDNDGDGAVDCNDADCAGILYSCRNNAGIDSAIYLPDPCINNLCSLNLGSTKVYYLQKVRVNNEFRAKFVQDNIINKLTQVAINNLSSALKVSDATTSKRQLSLKLVTNTSLTSKSYTPDNDPNNDIFTGDLRELLTLLVPSAPGNYSVEFVRSIDDATGTARATEFFQITNDAPVYESDYINSSGQAEYCYDGLDNDLNSPLIYLNGSELNYTDCKDPYCNGSIVFGTSRCNYPNEYDCGDLFDNDMNDYVDCYDNACFKNSTYCPSEEKICYDLINNDFDYGIFGIPSISLSFQESNKSHIALTDCLDIDCNGSIGNNATKAKCEYGNETTCDDEFDNDADGVYDCYVTGTTYEEDCDRWHKLGLNYVCQMNETICYDDNDNDLDNSHPEAPYYGGIDCSDLDCNKQIGSLILGTYCEYGVELTCDDNFDNNRNGLMDCYDDNCKNKGLMCRPCPSIENITIDSCANGIDDDFDGYTDCNDIDCINEISANGYLCEEHEISCNDNIDNDGDGKLDCDDLDCNCYSDELSAGLCKDGKDNDNDNATDCEDEECKYTVYCFSADKKYPSYKQTSIGTTTIVFSDYLHNMTNASFKFIESGISGKSVLLLVGDINYPINSLNPEINNSATYLTGTTGGFVKLTNENTLQAENPSFSGNLNISLIAYATSTGLKNLRLTKSIEGSAGYINTNLYVSETEAPRLISANPENNSVTSRIFTLYINATDNTTYNSGIEKCTLNMSGITYESSKCVFNLSLSEGIKTIGLKIYDGAWNIYETTLTYNISSAPVQDGTFYSFTNYPSRKHFDHKQYLGIGVNFNSTNGFMNNTYCLVRFYDLDNNLVATSNVNLYVIEPNRASCTGEINMNILPSDGFYKFNVEITDASGLNATSTMESIFLCEYKNLTIGNISIYACLDECELRASKNRAPIFIKNISDITIEQDTSYSGLDMDDYFIDPDGDYLVYNATNLSKVTIKFNQYGIITIKPDKGFYGTKYFTVYAYDPYGAYNYSNLVKLTITKKEIPPPQPPSGGGGGGAGGGAMPYLGCKPNWICSAWGPCLPTGIQTRICRDYNNCSDPVESSQKCEYIPTCFDGYKNGNETGIDCGGNCGECPSCHDNIQNQGETGIDCGGPCAPCPTCHDGIKNQGEERTDCGGPCPACPTCHDGIKNQGEEDVDYGGPCPKLRIIERPMLIKGFSIFSLLALLILISLILFKYGDRISAKIKKRFTPKKMLKDECNDYLSDLVNIEQRADQISEKELFVEFEKILKNFIYHITHEKAAIIHDLMSYMENTIDAAYKKEIASIVNQYNILKYSGKKVSKETTLSMIKKLKKILENIKDIHIKKEEENNEIKIKVK